MARRQVVGARVRQTVIDLWGNECWLNLARLHQGR